LAINQNTEQKQQAGGTNEASGGKESFQISAPSISLPKGGGAIRGIGEKFAANPVTGTGSMTVPIATSPGRSGFGPQLSLSYDSGSGNGPFGFGWSLSLPSITRKTDKSLPKYQDYEESDIFILSGSEDLVPVLIEDRGERRRDAFERTVDGVNYSIQRYRPRIEGLFARIERWTSSRTGEIHWRSISRDNITTWYGKTRESRIADPENPMHIFSWLICESYDDKGNAIVYEYKAENSEQIDICQVHERNRTDSSRSANRYIKRIKYANKTSRLIEPDLSKTGWLFEVIFDYGDGHYEDLPLDSAKAPDEQHRFAHSNVSSTKEWPVREDPISSFRATFEVRTYRLCQRVLMFHHFPDELGTEDYLVRSTEFTYRQSPVASFITSVTQSGYKLQSDGKYLKKSLPPLEFECTEAVVHDKVKEVDAESLENLPYGLDESTYQWVDLDGEGLPGILTEQGTAWFYKRNLSPINLTNGNGSGLVEARFGPIELIGNIPNTSITAGGAQFMDLAGDGQPDLVEMRGPVKGFYEHTEDQGWVTFRPFLSWPNVDPSDPNLRFVDLDGDGHADILITKDDVLTWYSSLAEEGYGPAQHVYNSLDEEKSPRLVFSDGTQSIYLADMSGDGLTDLVRIRNGEVCYWPNLGYGRFGCKVTMENSPWFDQPDLFDQQRMRVADIDGSGNTDIIYLHTDGVRLYFNRSGNSWSMPRTLDQFPRAENLSSVTTVDLLGNGTACLVWSSPLPGNARRPMRYIDLMGGQKPHLLVKTLNNLGAETLIEYAPSTKFYLADKRDGKPWITRLPFPVHVVERVETHDLISRNRFVTRYAYHHGYYDGIEREFRGFGMVEQFDTEELAALTESGNFPDATNIDAASYVPTVLTKTWFHTGAYIEGERISLHFEEEYYHEGDESEGVSGLTDLQLEAMLLPDTKLPTTLKRLDGSSIPWELTAEEIREACRALKGAVLRREIYALDETDDEDRPYSATEQNYTVELLQPQRDNQHAVFFTHPRESIDFHYERKLVQVSEKKIADPRVTHTMTLEVDGYGNVLKSVAIGYGRRPGLSPLQGDDKKKQEQLLITYTETAVTNPIHEMDDHRTPLPCEARTYELLKVVPDSNLPEITNLFEFDEMIAKVGQASDGSHDLPYEDIDAAGATANHPYQRLIEHVRTLYRRNNLSGPLPLGQLDSLAIPFESYKLAFTPSLLAGVYGTKVTDFMLADEGRYVHSEGDNQWWILSGKAFFGVNVDIMNPANTAALELVEARAHFFLPRKFADPFSQSTTVDYDIHKLLVIKSEDALHNTVNAANDYRVLQPQLVTDPNGNRSEVAFDALGMVAGTSVMGKVGENVGDLLTNFNSDLIQQDINDFFDASDPHLAAPNLLRNASTRIIYDLDCFKTSGQPVFSATLARETHTSDPLPPGGLKIQISFSYSNGFGREIQKKIQAELGPVVEGGPVVNPRWVGSGWTIFNNKGKPVRQYEPFFDNTHDFKFGVAVGVSPVLFYDPVERLVATLHPNHTYEKVVFDPWQQTSYDVNDTVTFDPKTDDDIKEFFTRLPDTEYLPTWYGQRSGGQLGSQEEDAATKAAVHTGTPAVSHFDSLGRPLLTIAHNKFERNAVMVEEKYSTRVEMDIEGNQRKVIDANLRIVMRYDYDMLGTRIHQASMEASEHWRLSDVTGKPIRAWDSRGHQFKTEYDQLRRPLRQFVRGTDTIQSDPRTLNADVMFARIEYGEGEANDTALNLRTRVFKSYDGAGVITSDEYDFKGNLGRSSRTVADDYKKVYDWNNDTVDPSWETFHSSTTYDALDRPKTVTAPDASVYRPTFNEANLLEALDINLRGAQAATRCVRNIDYNAKGQRVLIEYDNNIKTEYGYDSLTFRLSNLKTTRLTDQARLQDLSYTYDPAGNVTQIKDSAQQTIYFNSQVVTPDNDYHYDAIYRLINAEGREHIGQTGFDFNPPDGNYRDYPFVGHRVHSNDGQSMRRYTERYEYDAVGTFLQLIHQATNGNWTRGFAYGEPSLIEPSRNSNRLSSTTVGANNPETYSHDAHGNMSVMPHLTVIRWDFKDQLSATSRQAVNAGTAETTYYVYDGAGQRLRKVTERQNGTRKNERTYLGGFEVYREYGGSGTSVTLERETVHVMDDKQRVALVETRTKGQDGSPAQLMRYQFSNHLGSVSLELDATGQMISYEEYYPYGNSSYQAGRSAVEVTLKRYRYTGIERDEESGLNYHNARYCASWLGTWLSVDPEQAKFPDWSPYSYALDNPVVFTDASGMSPEEKVLRHLTKQIVERIGEVTGRLDALSGELRELNARAEKLRAQGLSQPQIESRLGKDYAALEGARDVAMIDAAAERRGAASVSKQIEELESKLGRTIPADPELGGNLADLLKQNTDKLRQSVSKAEALKLSVPHPPKPPEPPKPKPPEKKPELPEARVVEREEKGVWKKLKKFFGFAKEGKSAVKEASTVVKAAKAIVKGGEVVFKALPFIGAGICIAEGMEHLSEGRYFRAAVDFAEAIPVVGDVVLAADLTVQLLGDGLLFLGETLRTSPGSLLSPGFATPFVLHGGYRGLLRSPMDLQRDIDARNR
jgi:RHS repeat-associated protein